MAVKADQSVAPKTGTEAPQKKQEVQTVAAVNNKEKPKVTGNNGTSSSSNPATNLSDRTDRLEKSLEAMQVMMQTMMTMMSQK